MSEATSPERLLAILELFERERRPLSLKEIGELCGIPPSTCHNLVRMLRKRAYLYHAGARRDLYPTRRLYDLGATILAHDPVLERLRPAMAGLREATRETVILGKRQKDRIIYLEVLEGPQVIRYSSRAGDTKPLHSTCVGKTILSTLARPEIEALLRAQPLDRVTPNTITSLDGLLEDLDRGREEGVFTSRGENVADVTAMAVPLHINDEVYGLAVAGPAHRVDADFGKMADALKSLRDGLRHSGIASAG